MNIKTVLATGVAAFLLCGCAEGPGYGVAGFYGSGPGDYAYNGYYDDYYGPIYDGYWRGDSFYWRDREGGPMRHDTGQHFRHDAAPGFHHVAGAFHGGHRGRHQG